VCKLWYNTYLQNSIICNQCKKFIKVYDTQLFVTDSDDVSCHLHPLYCKKYEIATAVITDSKTFIDILKEFNTNLYIGNDITIAFINKNDETHIRINLRYTNYGNSLIDLKCNRSDVSKILCKKMRAFVTVDFENFYTMISNFSHSQPLELSIIHNNESKDLSNNKLLVKVSNQEIGAITKYVEQDKKNIKDVYFFDLIYDVKITMKLTEFSTLCLNTINHGSIMKIKCSKNKVVFSVNNLKTSYVPNINNDIINLDYNLPSIGKFALSKIIKFNKCGKLSDKIILYLTNKELILQYNIDSFATFAVSISNEKN
jgi:hypothetical protein